MTSLYVLVAQGDEDADLLEEEYGADEGDDDYGIDHYASDGEGDWGGGGGGGDDGEATF